MAVLTPAARHGRAIAGWPGRRRPAYPGPGLGREITTFAAIGVVSTAAYAVLYLALRPVVEPAVASAVSLLVTAIGNTAANRRLTFGVRDRGSILRDQAGGLLALGVALVLTTVSVSVLGVLVPAAGRVVELAVLVTANVLATVVRFGLLRMIIGGRHPSPGPAIAGDRSPS